MTLSFSYESDLFLNLPENSGHLAIYIDENRCDIAIGSSALVLLALNSFTKDEDEPHFDFLKAVFAEQQSLFARNFQNTNIGFHYPNFTIIPNEFESIENQSIELLTGSDDPSYTKPIPFLDSKLVYQIPQKIKSLIDSSIERYTETHLVVHSLNLARQINSDLFLLIDDNHFDIVAKKNDHIYAVNRFKRGKDEDVLYFSLLSLKEIDIEPENAKITISGYCPPNGQLHQKLLDFIQEVEVRKVNDVITIRSDFDQPTHYAEAVVNLLNANN